MITVLYSDVLNQAAEVAGRTRDKLPVKEALMCQGFLATALREVWNGNYQWPELIKLVQVLPVNPAVTVQNIPKQEGTANALGDILGVWTGNPQGTYQYYGLRFEEQDNAVYLPDGPQASVWVEYMLPCPDLNAFNATTQPALLAYPIPVRFRNFLAWSAAGHLCRADGQVAQGDEFLALARSEIIIEQQRLAPVPRRPARQRDLYVDNKMSATPAQSQ